jgi:predicted tellurium resistance membrane protein TerC
MQILHDPQTWLSFVTLTVLEIVLGIDNIVFLSILVSRLPPQRQGRARILGLGFAMLTRLGLLFSITWLATLTAPWVTIAGHAVTGRAAVLFGGGLFLAAKSVAETAKLFSGRVRERKAGLLSNFWLIVLQIGVIDVVFSLDSVFTAVGLASHREVMVAAIVFAVAVMMLISGYVSDILNRYPTLKVLALGFLLLIGFALMAEGLALHIPKGYLYFALAFSAAVEWVNIGVGKRVRAPSG